MYSRQCMLNSIICYELLFFMIIYQHIVTLMLLSILSLQENYDMTLLHLAAYKGHYDIVTVVYEQYNANIVYIDNVSYKH